jgi:hypothetical protein
MIRLAVGAFLALLPLPAVAAGGWDDLPPQMLFYIYGGMFLLGAVPAAGVGFVLGTFLKFSGSVLSLAILFMIPVAWVLVSRGLEPAVELARAAILVVLFLSPAVYLGWHLGRKEAARHETQKRLLRTGR